MPQAIESGASYVANAVAQAYGSEYLAGVAYYAVFSIDLFSLLRVMEELR